MATPSRRGLFAYLTYALGAIAGVLFAAPFVGYLLGPLRKHIPLWVTLGPVDKYPEGETRLETFDNPLRQPWDGATSHTGVHVRRLDGERFVVFAINCTHLGCPVTWFPQSGLFLCPCHGGVFYENGDHASGPPPRGLFQCEWRVRNGKLEVQAPHLPTLRDPLRDADV